MTSPNERNSPLADQIASTLDRGVEQIDDHQAARLKQIRRQALSGKQHHLYRQRIAVAAAVAALAAMPWLLRDNPVMDPGSEESIAYLSVDPEMLATMDMLAVLGEPLDAI